MARYNGLIIPRSYNDYYSRSDPQAIRDIVALAADAELNAESKNPLQNQAIAKIVPNTASETNKLADKNFVNSTVGTNTANYIYKTESGGEKVPFSSVAELEAYAGTVTNNDYAFVTGIDENGNTYYDRYKADVNDGVVTWAKEYRLNNSSFTAEQWAAIQSGITAEKVAQFEGAVAPVDVVQSGNMSAVTSNAVYEALTDAATLQQALQLPGVLSEAVAAGDNKAVKSSAVATALAYYQRQYSITSNNKNHLIYIGKTINANNSQAFTQMKVKGGRVDGFYGEGTIYLGQKGNLFSTRLDCQMPNLTFYINKFENEYYFYCQMESYCQLVVEVMPGSKIDIVFESVNSPVGVEFWNNTW